MAGRTAGRLPHGLTGDPAERGDRGGQGSPVRQYRQAGRGHGRGSRMGRVQANSLGRAAGGLTAQVGPVAAVLDAQSVPQFQAGRLRLRPDVVDDRGDQLAWAVTDDDRHGLPLAGQDGDRVLGDGARGGGGRGVGKVKAEGDVNAAVRRPGAEHDQAAGRDEAEQVRDDGEDRGRGADADGARRGRRRRRRRRGRRGRRVLRSAGAARVREVASRGEVSGHGARVAGAGGAGGGALSGLWKGEGACTGWRGALTAGSQLCCGSWSSRNLATSPRITVAIENPCSAHHSRSLACWSAGNRTGTICWGAPGC